MESDGILKLERISFQLEKAYKGSAWHGPSLLEALEDVDFAKAYKPDASIWEMVLHVAAANETVTKRLHGVPATMTL